MKASFPQKRMIVFDLDSTLIQGEVIDEFAKEKGVYDEVAAITLQAMEGKLDFDESLRCRTQKLKGLSLEQIDRVYARLNLMPGAEELIQALKKQNYKTAILSGSFILICDRIRERLGIDFAFGNQLEVQQGQLTGRVIPPIINAQRKAELLEMLAQQEGISLDNVVAVGDGANDLLMIQKAGLGIAFNAKPILQQNADLSLNQKDLRVILDVLGKY